MWENGGVRNLAALSANDSVSMWFSTCAVLQVWKLILTKTSLFLATEKNCYKMNISNKLSFMIIKE